MSVTDPERKMDFVWKYFNGQASTESQRQNGAGGVHPRKYGTRSPYQSKDTTTAFVCTTAAKSLEEMPNERHHSFCRFTCCTRQEVK